MVRNVHLILLMNVKLPVYFFLNGNTKIENFMIYENVEILFFRLCI